MSSAPLDLVYTESNPLLGITNRAIVPFVACGDLSGLDSDMSYPLLPASVSASMDDGSAPEAAATAAGPAYTSLPPVQAPIKPAYEAYLSSRRASGDPRIAK